jgi:hypothetical protein
VPGAAGMNVSSILQEIGPFTADAGGSGAVFVGK